MTKIPIFLSSDNNYAPLIATTIASICDNTKSFCDFYILDSGVSNENKQKICELKKQFNNFSIEFISIDKKLLNSIKYQNSATHVSISTYNRFLISFYKPNLTKVLHLDVDLIVKGDIANLYSIDMGKYSLGAIPENFKTKYEAANIKERQQTLQLSNTHKYFNAGVLLINNEKWVENNISNKLFETEIKLRDKLKFADQDVLNKCFDNSYMILDKKYNFMTQNECSSKDFIIRHYTTVLKPWQIAKTVQTDLLYDIDIFWEYAEITPFYEELKNKIIYNSQKNLTKFKIAKMWREKNA